MYCKISVIHPFSSVGLEFVKTLTAHVANIPLCDYNEPVDVSIGRTSVSLFCSPVCGDMNAVCACGAAGLAEPGLEPRDLKAGGLWDAMPGPEELGKPFSQPADIRN